MNRLFKISASISLVLFASLNFAAAQQTQSAATQNLLKLYASQYHKLWLAKEFEEALRIIDKGLKLDPQNVEFNRGRAWCLYEAQENDSSALAQADKTLALKGGAYSSTYELKGRILMRMKRYSQAIRAIDDGIRAWQREPRNMPSAMHRLGLLYAQRACIEEAQGKLAAAENDFGKAIESCPESLEHRSKRVQINIKLQNWPKVIADSKHILKYHKPGIVLECRDAYLALARAYAAQQNRKDAESIYFQASREYPCDRQVLAVATKYFDSINDKKNAEIMRKKLSSMDEDFVPFK